MNTNRHASDAAWELSKAVVRIFSPLLRDEELIDAHSEVFDVVMPALTDLLGRYARESARVAGTSDPSPHPSRPLQGEDRE